MEYVTMFVKMVIFPTDITVKEDFYIHNILFLFLLL